MPTPDDRPNILLIMTDQQRGDALGIEGHPVLRTPNMDHLAADGTWFGRAYSTCPSCIPARRSLMSGQFPASHGLVGYRDGQTWDPPATLPGELRKAGYHTAIVGRNMHLHPLRKRYGYDEQVIIGDWLGVADYERFLAEHEPAAAGPTQCGRGPGAGGYYGTGVFHNDRTARPWHLPEPLHPTQWTVNEALRFLDRRDPSCPFFLTVSFWAPHPPFTPPAVYFDRYLRAGAGRGDDVPVIGDWAAPVDLPPEQHGKGLGVDSVSYNLTGQELAESRAGYFGLIHHVDDQIRRLLNPMNLPANTVVIFTSDHGEMLGDHHLFRKSLPYEGSARVPLMVRGPQTLGLGRGVRIDQPVCLEDIMPTCLELAGCGIPDSVDGRSLLPLMRGEGRVTPWREYLHGEHGVAVRPEHANHYMTDGRWKYIWYSRSGIEQLFDLAADPRECRNLAEHPNHAAALARWRDRLIERLVDRPEGFVAGGRLVPGQAHEAVMPTRAAMGGGA